VTENEPFGQHITNQEAYDRAVKVAVKKGYIAHTDKEHAQVFVAEKRVPHGNDAGAYLPFHRFFGDSLLRVISKVNPPTTKVTFETETDKRKSTVTMRLDASVRELYEMALKTLGTYYMPPDLLEQYRLTNERPSLEQMEEWLKVKLYVGDTEISGTTLNEMNSNNKSAASLGNRKELPVKVQFFTRHNEDWNSCVVQVYISFSHKKKNIMTKKFIPNITLVLGSAETFADLKSKIRQHIAEHMSLHDSYDKFEIKDHQGNTIGIDRDKETVCKLGGRYLMVYITQG
jgi:hypothetical protein